MQHLNHRFYMGIQCFTAVSAPFSSSWARQIFNEAIALTIKLHEPLPGLTIIFGKK
jgi:hypothetical protein